MSGRKSETVTERKCVREEGRVCFGKGYDRVSLNRENEKRCTERQPKKATKTTARLGSLRESNRAGKLLL